MVRLLFRWREERGKERKHGGTISQQFVNARVTVKLKCYLFGEPETEPHDARKSVIKEMRGELEKRCVGSSTSLAGEPLGLGAPLASPF